jgi:hypothetical protein
LSLTDNAEQFLYWIACLRRNSFDEMLIVPLPQAAQPSNETRHHAPISSVARGMRDYFTSAPMAE